MANKYLEKVASLLKGKKLIMKTTSGSIPAVKAQGKDIGMIGRMIDRVDQVEKIRNRAGSTYKTRLNFPDGYKGFIRASDKGVRSRLYKDD